MTVKQMVNVCILTGEKSNDDFSSVIILTNPKNILTASSQKF